MLKKKYFGKNKVTGDVFLDRFTNLGYEPLSREEEISLIKKLKLPFYDDVCDEDKELYLNYYFEEFPEFKRKYEITDDKDKLLEEAIEKATEYRDYFLVNNRRLVYTYVKMVNASRCDLPDLFQDGLIGMMMALRKFDVESGNKFSTCASWWIREAIIKNAKRYSNLIKLPDDINGKIYAYNRISSDLKEELGREPLTSELASKMDEADIEKVLIAKNRSYIRSLNESISEAENDNCTLADFIIDPTDQIEEADDRISLSILYDIINNLGITERERKIFYMRYGLNGFEVHTLGKIAKEFNLSRERIRQIERKILHKLYFDKDFIELHNDMVCRGKKIKVLRRY